MSKFALLSGSFLLWMTKYKKIVFQSKIMFSVCHKNEIPFVFHFFVRAGPNYGKKLFQLWKNYKILEDS